MTAAKPLVFRVHALQRMFERNISPHAVRDVVASGETIEDYPEDMPYPSRLVLGWSDSRPLHAVVADNNETEETIVITVYYPEPDRWDSEFRRRLA